MCLFVLDMFSYLRTGKSKTYIYSHNYDIYIVSKRHNFAFMRKKVEFEGYSFVFESYKVTIV